MIGSPVRWGSECVVLPKAKACRFFVCANFRLPILRSQSRGGYLSSRVVEHDDR